jgi:hypothetical protein
MVMVMVIGGREDRIQNLRANRLDTHGYQVGSLQGRGSGVKGQQKRTDGWDRVGYIVASRHCVGTRMVFRFNGGDFVSVADAGFCNGLGEL